MGIKNKKILYYQSSLKNPRFKGWRLTKNSIYGMECLKKAGWGLGQFTEGLEFLKGFDTPMHTM